MDSLVGKLRDAGAFKGDMVVCDATFIKAYSKRDPKDDSSGYSDLEAMVGRAGKTYQLGYKLHLAVDAHSDFHWWLQLLLQTKTRRSMLQNF